MLFHVVPLCINVFLFGTEINFKTRTLEQLRNKTAVPKFPLSDNEKMLGTKIKEFLGIYIG